MKRMRSGIKVHGGKWYLSPWIISAFPENYHELTYVEPYCGGASVLLNKKKSPTEVMNDLDLGIVQIHRAVRDEPKEFQRRLNLCKYTEETFQRALKKTTFEDYLEHAVTEFVLRRMSRGGLKKAFAWSDRLRGGQPGDVNAWKTALKLIPELAERLQGVYIFNKKALEIIKTFNAKNVLLYCDPPYLHETRISKLVYSSEMTTEDHIELANVLNSFQGKAMISGYSSPLYSRLYKGWNMEKKAVANHSSQKKTKEKKTEIVWKNW